MGLSKVYIFLRNIYNLPNNFRLKKLRKNIRIIGKGVELPLNIKISKPENLEIGSYVYIGPGAVFQSIGGINIGSGTIIGPNLKIYTANHRFRNAKSIPYDEIYDLKPVEIGQNVWFGGDVIVVPGSNIGEGSIVGAGCVVSGNIPPLSIIVGNPARIISTRDEFQYNKLKNENMIYLKLKQEGLLKPNWD